MRPARAGFALLAAVAFGQAAALPAQTGSARPGIDLPAGRLAEAVVALGRQADVSVGFSDPALAGLAVKGVHGATTAAKALGRLLAGTDARFVRIDGSTFRIMRRIDRAGPHAAPAPKAPPAPAAPPPVGDIVVSASKRDIRFGHFPAAATLLDGATLGNGSTGTEAIVDRLPVVSSTHLGPGRNKLFIRGVADSSFNGPTQATVGQYLGDVRLNYNAPDPDLTTYDIDRVEVLEGPQGTLYGAGSLGGIVRLVPAAPKLDGIEASMSLGHSASAHGADGGDAAAMLNLPLRAGVAGLRLVAYRSVDGGYIEDARRMASDINRTRSAGGRATLRVAPGDGWTVDLGGVLQNINSRDSQYAERGLPRLTRASAVAQPFDNDYLLGQLVVTKAWPHDLHFTSASAVVRHQVSARNDATADGGPPRVFVQDNHILLASNETRLTRTNADGTGWLIGTSIVSDNERLTRTIGPPGGPVRITGVRNATTDVALYGELTVALAPSLQLTGGGRLAYARLAGKGLDLGRHGHEETTRTEVELLPSIALAWTPTGRLILFARYQEGFRPGGLSIGGEASTRAIQRFQGDSIGTVEAGVRFGAPERDRWSGAATISYGRWDHIQADLVGLNGLPFSANIGSGDVLGLEANLSWRPLQGLSLEGALFLNDSRLLHPAEGFENSRDADLPNIGDVGGRGAIDYRFALGRGTGLSLNGSARYVGRSSLGVGSLLGISQGRYVDTALGARVDHGPLGLSLRATNLFDIEGNRFSLGNPFGVTDGRQITPLRPRTIRLGLDARF